MKEKRQKRQKASLTPSIDADDRAGAAAIDDKKAENNALSLCKKARTLWLQKATKHEDLDMVEEFYRQALNAKRQVLTKAIQSKDYKSKKRKRNNSTVRKMVAALSPEEYRKAGERLSLLYLQSGRPYKATMGLKYLGFECRLSERILNYPTSIPSQPKKTSKQKRKKHQRENNHRDSDLGQPPCCVVDNFLSPIELNQLRKVFGNVNSSYWSFHNYIIDKEPRAPYFSYVIDLKENRRNNKGKKPSFVRRIIDKILRSKEVEEKFASLRRDARYVEMWAHNRPHASGHQLHFDSDDEGRSRQQGFPNHPICSFVLNVSSHARVGGPTLVTNQRLRNPETTNLQGVRGWLVPSRPSRLVCFDGSVLHGVIPGKGCIPEPLEDEIGNFPAPRRVTLMMAFWKEIKVRQGDGPGSARPWPSSEGCLDKELPAWAKEMNRTDVYSEGSSNLSSPAPTSTNQSQCTQIIPIQRVYELFDGSSVPKYHIDESSGDEVYYMPEYDKVFQGF